MARCSRLLEFLATLRSVCFNDASKLTCDSGMNAPRVSGAAPALAAAPEAGAADVAAHPGEPSQLTFATFVISLSTQALALLGEIPDPVQGRTAVDLDGARQFIDILGILRDKTRGNLDEQERKLLESLLYEIRMRFVEFGK